MSTGLNGEACLIGLPVKTTLMGSKKSCYNKNTNPQQHKIIKFWTSSENWKEVRAPEPATTNWGLRRRWRCPCHRRCTARHSRASCRFAAARGWGSPRRGSLRQKKATLFKAATRKALQPLRGNLSNKQPNHKIRIGYFCPTLAKKCPMSRQSKNLTKSQNLIGYNDDNLGTFRWHTTGLETGLSVQTLQIKTTTILRMVPSYPASKTYSEAGNTEHFAHLGIYA